MTSNDNSKSRTTMVLAIFAMAIGVVAYYGVKYPIPQEGASGTVAPAERFRGEQISSEDVALGDEGIAQLMQTDIYQKMVEDPEVAQAMMDVRMTTALASPAMQALYRDRVVAEALQTSNLHHAISHTAVQQALVSNQALQTTLKNPDAFKMALEAAAQLQAYSEKSQTLDAVSQEMAEKMHRQNLAAFQQTLSNNAEFTARMQADPALQAVFEDGRLADALTNRAFLNAVADSNVMASLRDHRVLAALSSENLRTALTDNQIASTLADEQLVQAMANVNLLNAMQDERMVHALADEQFRSRLQSDLNARMHNGDASLHRY